MFTPVYRGRYFIVPLLLVIFLSPYGIKVADMVIHHHYTSHYVATPETEYSVEGHFCPIPGFQYHTFVFQQAIGETEGIRFNHQFVVFRTRDPFITRYVLSFSLRGPPLPDNIS